MLNKIMVGMVLLGALFWALLLGTHGGEATGFISYTYLASGTSDSTVVITGKPASNLSVYNSGANDVAVSWNNNGADAGSVPGGTTMTWTGIEVYQFTLDRTSATTVYAWTW